MRELISIFDRCCGICAMVCLTLAILVPEVAFSGNAALTFEERVDWQRAVEGVLWQHRIWPAQNPGPKPPLSDVLPEHVLRRKVDDTLRLSTALTERWHRPITQADLQAELDRIIAETLDPEMLDELFLALEYDPVLAAECLARPLLVGRAARQAFAEDRAIHGEGRRQAEVELAGAAAKGLEQPAHGELTETEWVRYGLKLAKYEVMREGDVPRLYLSPSQWEGLVGGLDVAVADLEKGQLAPLQNADDRWWSAAVLETRDGYRRVVHMSWRKLEFEDWWAQRCDGVEPATIEPGAEYEIGLLGKRAPDANTWTDTAIGTYTPSVRELHTAVWTGSEMIIFGGMGTQGTLWNGGRFLPATNSWVSMTSGGSGIGSRGDHTAVWSGSQMIVWGGWSNGELDTGGRYAPSSDTWSTTTVTNVPDARRYHAACWAGGTMLVFGGWSGSYHIGTGAEYSTSNSWTTLPTETGSVTDPSPRSDHVIGFFPGGYPYAVIWGGQNGSGALGDGRRLAMLFNPPRWQAMATADAPAARWDHSGVVMSWNANVADRRLLVWGGTSNGTSGLLDGGAFEPSSNDWEPVTPASAPTARWGHEAVWTGKTMIVWGGEGSTGALRTGGIFNYFNQKWLTTSVTNAPSARTGHTAVYRQQTTSYGQLVVWGGNEGSPTGPTDTGGIYVPRSDYILYGTKRIVLAVPGAYLANAARVYGSSVNSFSGSVSLSIEGSPPMTTSFSKNPLTVPANGSDNSYLTFSSIDVSLADHEFEIVGNSGGSIRRYDMVLRIQDYDIACVPAAVSAAPGEDAVTTCTVSSLNGFSSDVDLSCASPPFSCTFDPTPVDPPADGEATSELTVHVPAGQAPGSYQVEIDAAALGAFRLFDLGLEVSNIDHIFSDDFESGNTSAWE